MDNTVGMSMNSTVGKKFRSDRLAFWLGFAVGILGFGLLFRLI